MPIAIRCTSCQATLGAPDGSAGRQVRCTGCGAVLVVPGARPAIPPPPPVPRPPAPPPPVAPPPEDESPFEDIGPADPFAGVGTDEPVLARHKNLQRYRRPLGWRFFVTVGGGVACSWLAGVLVISWGRGPAGFVASLVGSVLGSLCLGSCGAFVGMVMWLRAGQAALVAKAVNADLGTPRLKYLLALTFAGFLLLAPFGALGGAVGGAAAAEKRDPTKRKSAREREQEERQLWYGVLAAAGGALLGAAPGAVLCLMYRARPFDEDEERSKKKDKRPSRRRERD